MIKFELPLMALVINFILFAILGYIFGTNIESIILSGVLIICANLWAVAEYMKPNSKLNENKNDEQQY